MARGKTSNDDFVLVRIRRMGNQWATCGIGVRPPEHLVGDKRMKSLCPKLVPGQCRRLPRNHPILKPQNSELVEIVSRPRADEFECPWVFDTAEDAVRANPSKSHLSADQIAEALALTEGAKVKQSRELDKRQRAANEHTDDYDDRVRIRRDDMDDEGELEDDGDGENEDVNARRSQNRHIREDDEEGEGQVSEETPPARRRRPGRQRS